jgi:hypothetical protein
MSTQPPEFNRKAFVAECLATLSQKLAAQAPEGEATRRQLANQQNARQSTGPRTAAGKAASSKNRLAHGLCSSALLVGDESPDDLASLRTEFYHAYQPATPEERILTDQLVEAQWRLNRARTVEAKTQDFLIFQAFENLIDDGESIPFSTGQMHAASLLQSANEAAYRNIQRYVAAIERSHQRALKNLHYAQEKRRSLPPPPPEITETKVKAAAATQALPEVAYVPPTVPATDRQAPDFVNRP